MAGGFAIAQVTPYAWEAEHPVNAYVDGVARELGARGHRLLIVAPSRSSTLVRDSRAAIRDTREHPGALLPEAGEAPRVLGVGEVLPFPPPSRAAASRSASLDVSKTIGEALGEAPLDIVHVHEPFAPSAAAAALRHSRALNVGSFHAPSERVISTQVARRVVELFFGRLDARTASFAATRDLLTRYFPADYRLLTPAVDPPLPRAERAADAPARILFCFEEERPALRLFLRALRRLPLDLPWEAIVWSPRGVAFPPARLRSDVRERITFCHPDDDESRAHGEAVQIAGADIAVLASDGANPAPASLLRALAGGVAPVASRLPIYEELLDEGARGLLFEADDVDTLAGQLKRLIADRALRDRLVAAADPLREQLTWSRVADELEDVYAGLAARRHDTRPNPALAARLEERPLIDVDLHMHTDHSFDCATPVDTLLETAKRVGLGAIAVTDHNVVTGALEAAERADGIKVIVAEEVKTADQGEVIGLFIKEHIDRGMTLAETIAEIKRQGGLVYVPHPFDRMHSVPDYEHLLEVVEDIDAIEVFNARVAVREFNQEAVRFAAKYRIAAGGGSDAHVAQGLGSVRIRMRDFDGPEEFLASLRAAEVIRTPASLLYVQALKFIQTKATPATRRAVRKARVRRSTRNG